MDASLPVISAHPAGESKTPPQYPSGSWPLDTPGGRFYADRQSSLPQAQGEGWDAQATPWCGKIAVLVTSLDAVAFPTIVMPKQYRERADAENCFDELKNQWGWGGYTKVF